MHKKNVLFNPLQNKNCLFPLQNKNALLCCMRNELEWIAKKKHTHTHLHLSIAEQKKHFWVASNSANLSKHYDNIVRHAIKEN